MPAVVSPSAGTRTEPKDGYQFVRGTTAIFKVIFLNNGRPTTVDTGTSPQIKLMKPVFLTRNTTGVPEIMDTVDGTLVSGQEFEYQFSWNIPADSTPSDEYIVSYYATVGGIYRNYADEFWTISDSVGQIDVAIPAFATPDDVRQMKFNIDDYLPQAYRKDLVSRNTVLQTHLQAATDKLREELALYAMKLNTPNFKRYVVYQTIYTILLAARGEDGSSVSDQNLIFWRTEAERILEQEKRKHGVGQSVCLGRG